MTAGERRADELDRGAADLAGLDDQIGQVAVVRAHRIVAPVLRVGRVPMRPGAREIGRGALPDGVDVHAIGARSEAARHDLYLEPGAILEDVDEIGRESCRERGCQYV